MNDRITESLRQGRFFQRQRQRKLELRRACRCGFYDGLVYASLFWLAILLIWIIAKQ